MALPSVSKRSGRRPSRPVRSRLDRSMHSPLICTPFGVTDDGVPVELFTLTNSNGIELRVMSYGATIVSLRAPDRDGRLDDVVLGHDDLAGYERDSQYFGAVVGRYANRIARGRFTLDGVEYTLATNNGPNHLHGGIRGFDKHVWSAAGSPNEPSVRFSLVSAHGDEGYPGRLDAHVRYALTESAEVAVDFRATTDRPTVVNLTQHAYFHLAGARAVDVLGHELRLAAAHFLPVTESLLPTGAIVPVDDTPFDFRRPLPIGSRIAVAHEQLQRAGGYDHTFVLEGGDDALRVAAWVHEPLTGRTLTVRTSEPGVQLYTGNFLDGSILGKGGRPYGHRSGFCLETQHFPDSPNQPHFPPVVLRPGEEYRSRTVFAFGVRANR